MPETISAARRLLCIALLACGAGGCATGIVVSHPSFWDRCLPDKSCGPWVGGMLGSELLLYGIVAAVSSATSGRETDSEPKPKPEATPAGPAASAASAAAVPTRRKQAGEPSSRPPRHPRSPTRPRPVRHDYPSWP